MGARNPPEVEPPSGVTSRKAHRCVHIYMHSSPIMINAMMMNHNHHSVGFLWVLVPRYWRAANPLGAAVYSFSVRTTAALNNCISEISFDPFLSEKSQKAPTLKQLY